MVKNKKAAIILYPVIIGIIMGIAGYFIFSESFQEPPVGTKSMHMLLAANKAEIIFYYIDQSAQLSAKKTIYDLAEKGLTICGEFDKYPLLNNKIKSIDECSTKIEDKFKSIFNQNLNNYLTLYPYYILPIDNYEVNIDINNKKIIGYASQDIMLQGIQEDTYIFIKQIEPTDENVLFVYSLKPNFKVNLDFDFNIFEEIKQKSKELIEKCSEETNLESCINGNLILFNKESEIEWINSGNSSRTFKFDVNTHKKLFPFEEEVIIKFALYFPESTVT